MQTQVKTRMFKVLYLMSGISLLELVYDINFLLVFFSLWLSPYI